MQPGGHLSTICKPKGGVLMDSNIQKGEEPKASEIKCGKEAKFKIRQATKKGIGNVKRTN
jgi:hypothetical protein